MRKQDTIDIIELSIVDFWEWLSSGAKGLSISYYNVTGRCR